MAPKIENDDRGRQITGEEATHRLSFLADIVDTEGYAIKGVAANSMQEDLRAEAETVKDMFETNHFDDLADSIMRDENDRHAEVMREMREAIDKNELLYGKIDTNEQNGMGNDVTEPVGASDREEPKESFDPLAKFDGISKSESDVVVQPDSFTKLVENANEINENQPKSSIIELSNNPSYSVATIAKEANRINNKEEGEVFISLH